MKVISIGTDRKIFEKNSDVQQRLIEYGKFFDEMHVIVFNKRDTKNEIKITKISENVWAHPTNSNSKLFYVWDAFKICKKVYSNDFIVTVGDSFETGMVGVLTKLFLGLPLHVQVHTDLMHKYFRNLSVLNKLRFFVSEFVLRYADRVRVVSERIKQSIEQFSKNIDVLPIQTKLKEEKIERLKDWENIKNILTVCRLEKEKNLETAIKAFKTISEKFPEAVFAIVGDGSERENLEKFVVKLGLENKVVFAGWRDDLEKYYRNADIYISTSLYEGYGISTVEAAYFGKPLILSETGVAGEIFKDGESALVCDAKDTACFAKNILKIYQNKNLAQKMGQSAKLAADKHLNSGVNYFREYADSVLKTAESFKKRGFVARFLDFKKTFWHSFIFLRYLVCGVTAAVVNISSLYVFTETAGIWYLYSSILAFFLALIVSFSLQKFVVFKDNGMEKMHHQFSKFFVIAVLGVATNTILVFVCVEALGVWYILSQIIAGIFVMFQNFAFYKLFIFNK